MIRFGKYIIVLSKKELEEKGILWDEENHIRVRELGIFHLENVTYPQCFKYESPWDLHCCGDYYPCDKIEMVTDIENEIKELINLKKTIDTISIK